MKTIKNVKVVNNSNDIIITLSYNENKIYITQIITSLFNKVQEEGGKDKALIIEHYVGESINTQSLESICGMCLMLKNIYGERIKKNIIFIKNESLLPKLNELIDSYKGYIDNLEWKVGDE